MQQKIVYLELSSDYVQYGLPYCMSQDSETRIVQQDLCLISQSLKVCSLSSQSTVPNLSLMISLAHQGQAVKVSAFIATLFGLALKEQNYSSFSHSRVLHGAR